jgi:hypothetical protein
MTIKGTRRAALIILASCAASAAHAQTSRPQNGEFVRLDRPAVFDINPNTGSLKESVQKGQPLVWHPKEKPNEPRFQVTNMSVAFLRSESGGQVKMTFTGNISSLGYLEMDNLCYGCPKNALCQESDKRAMLLGAAAVLWWSTPREIAKFFWRVGNRTDAPARRVIIDRRSDEEESIPSCPEHQSPATVTPAAGFCYVDSCTGLLSVNLLSTITDAPCAPRAAASTRVGGTLHPSHWGRASVAPDPSQGRRELDAFSQRRCAGFLSCRMDHRNGDLDCEPAQLTGAEQERRQGRYEFGRVLAWRQLRTKNAAFH